MPLPDTLPRDRGQAAEALAATYCAALEKRADPQPGGFDLAAALRGAGGNIADWAKKNPGLAAAALPLGGAAVGGALGSAADAAGVGAMAGGGLGALLMAGQGLGSTPKGLEGPTPAEAADAKLRAMTDRNKEPFFERFWNDLSSPLQRGVFRRLVDRPDGLPNPAPHILGGASLAAVDTLGSANRAIRGNATSAVWRQMADIFKKDHGKYNLGLLPDRLDAAAKSLADDVLKNMNKTQTNLGVGEYDRLVAAAKNQLSEIGTTVNASDAVTKALQAEADAKVGLWGWLKRLVAKSVPRAGGAREFYAPIDTVVPLPSGPAAPPGMGQHLTDAATALVRAGKAPVAQLDDAAMRGLNRAASKAAPRGFAGFPGISRKIHFLAPAFYGMQVLGPMFRADTEADLKAQAASAYANPADHVRAPGTPAAQPSEELQKLLDKYIKGRP